MLTLKQTRSGTVVIGGGWPATALGDGYAGVCSDSLQGNLGIALRTVPGLAGARIVRSWAAVVNGNASWRPLIGALPGCADFFVNYVPWMGFSGGPAGARIVARLVQGRAPPVDFDVAHFRP